MKTISWVSLEKMHIQLSDIQVRTNEQFCIHMTTNNFHFSMKQLDYSFHFSRTHVHSLVDNNFQMRLRISWQHISRNQMTSQSQL